MFKKKITEFYLHKKKILFLVYTERQWHSGTVAVFNCRTYSKVFSAGDFKLECFESPIDGVSRCTCIAGRQFHCLSSLPLHDWNLSNPLLQFSTSYPKNVAPHNNQLSCHLLSLFSGDYTIVLVPMTHTRQRVCTWFEYHPPAQRGSEFFTVYTDQSTVSREVTTCYLMVKCRRFGWTCYLHIYGSTTSQIDRAVPSAT